MPQASAISETAAAAHCSLGFRGGQCPLHKAGTVVAER